MVTVYNLAGANVRKCCLTGVVICEDSRCVCV